MATAPFLVALIAYLFLASSLIAMVATDADIINIPGFSGFENTETNFSLLTNLSEVRGVVTAGSWNLSPSMGLYSTTPLTKNEIFFYGTNQSEGHYNNTYHIINPNSRLHGIYIYSQTGFNSIYLTVREEGFTLNKGISTIDFYQYSNAHQIPEYNLTTLWNIDAERLVIELDGVEIMNNPASKSALSSVWSFLRWNEYFAGVWAYGDNWQLQSLSSLYTMTADQSSFSIGDFVSTMSTILFWTLPEDIMPFWLNILLIKIPGIGVIFIIIQLIRGTG